MKRILKKTVVLVTVAALAITTMAGCGVKDSEIVAKVGDQKITAGVANFFARMQQSSIESYYASYYGEDFWGQEYQEGETFEENMKTSIMESLQEMYLLDAHKADYEIALTAEEEKAIEDAAAAFVKANKEKDAKKVSGTKEVVAEVLRLLTVQSKMQEVMIADVDRKVSDKEAAQKAMQYVAFSYTNTDESGNSTELSDDEKEALKKQAESFAKEAKKAKDFEALATKKGYKAETATFDSDSTTPAAELVQAADKLKKGGTTDVIVTDAGCYVARLTSTLDREATDAKKEEIISQRESDAYTALVDEWKEAVKIEVYDKVWKKISFEDLKVEAKVEETADTETTDTETTETETTETTEAETAE